MKIVKTLPKIKTGVDQLTDAEKEAKKEAEKLQETFKEIGTLEPNKDKTPSENAISVADGIAHPTIVSELP